MMGGGWKASYDPTIRQRVDGAKVFLGSRGDIKGKINRFWMQDGALAGARFDAAVDAGAHTDRKLGSIGLPALSANDPDTAANELKTHLILTGSADDGNEGMFSMESLLGGGTATDAGSGSVSDKAVQTIQYQLFGGDLPVRLAEGYMEDEVSGPARPRTRRAGEREQPVRGPRSERDRDFRPLQHGSHHGGGPGRELHQVRLRCQQQEVEVHQ